MCLESLSQGRLSWAHEPRQEIYDACWLLVWVCWGCCWGRQQWEHDWPAALAAPSAATAASTPRPRFSWVVLRTTKHDRSPGASYSCRTWNPVHERPPLKLSQSCAEVFQPNPPSLGSLGVWDTTVNKRRKELPGGPVVKNLPVSAGDTGSIPALEDPTHHGASKPVCHNCWALTLESKLCNEE